MTENETRFCSHCKKFLKRTAFTEFAKDWCISCRRIYDKKYTAKNKEKRKEQDRIRNLGNKEQRKIYNDQYRKDNLEEIREKDRLRYQERALDTSYAESLILYRELNKERLAPYHAIHRKQYYIKNKESILGKHKQYRIENPHYFVNYIRGRLLEDIEFSNLRKLRRYVTIILKPQILERDNHTCALCNMKFKYIELHIHHIIPVSKDPTKIKDLNNLITLCISCHLDKAHNGHYKDLNLEIMQQLQRKMFNV